MCAIWMRFPNKGQSMSRKFGLCLLGAAGVVAAGAITLDTARADTAGVLTCNVSSGWGFVFGSTRSLNCVYSATGERYVGRIDKFGVDLGFTTGGVIVWTVVAPTANLAPGALAGQYGGPTASATAAVGLGAHALVGGSNNTIALQPLTIEGNTGLNVAAGIAGVSLNSVQ